MISKVFGRRDETKLLLASGAMAAPLFVAVFQIEGARREGYEPIREPVSALALGGRGWIQRANFVGTGLAMLACSRGLRGSSAVRGGSVWGTGRFLALGLIGAGVFAMDPTIPVTAPASDPDPGTHVLHDAFSLVVFGALTGACFAYAGDFARRGRAGWAAYSLVSGTLVAGGVVLFGRGFAGSPRLSPIAGLVQRLTIVAGLGWLARLAGSELEQPAA